MRLDSGIEARIEFIGSHSDKRPESHLAIPARLEGESDQWTLLLEFTEVEGTSRKAVIDYLVGDAPSDQLEPGTSFELLEGPDVIATGEVL